MYYINSLINSIRITAICVSTIVLSLKAQGNETTKTLLPYEINDPDTLAIWSMNASEVGEGPDQIKLRGGAKHVEDGGIHGACLDLTPSIPDIALLPGSAIPGEDPSFTAEAWVKFITLDEGAQCVFDKSGGGQGFRFDRRRADKKWRMTLHDSEGNRVNLISERVDYLEVGKWYHVACSWDSEKDTARIWVDGKLIGEEVFQDLVYVDAPTGLALGAYQWNKSHGLKGFIDEVRLSSSVRTF